MAKLRLKSRIFLSIGRGASSPHVLAMRSQRSYPTAFQYNSGKAKRIDLDVLTDILMAGLGLSSEEVLEMKFGDLLEFRE